MQTVQEKIELLHEKLAKVKAGGGEKRVEKQHSQGKMTARERLAKLFDDNSFVELDQFVKHRCVNFGQDKKELPGEGVSIEFAFLFPFEFLHGLLVFLLIPFRRMCVKLCWMLT